MRDTAIHIEEELNCGRYLVGVELLFGIKPKYSEGRNKSNLIVVAAVCHF